MILVTGGVGFIGSNFILDWLQHETTEILNLDKLTYAGNLANLAAASTDPRYQFVRGDIGDFSLVARLLREQQPSALVHFAAESHVDRSIRGPGEFIKTNINGTFTLLEAAREYWSQLPAAQRDQFKFLHVSTDEVYGSLDAADAPFTELHRYSPNSPYSASKAASDHLVRAYFKTYGLPTLTTNSSNNYGPLQFPEKLIPLMILNGIAGRPLPIYGDGLHRRDWIYVRDHCAALRAVLARGRLGETYNIGGGYEADNLNIVHSICELLDELEPAPTLESHAGLIAFVPDRPGHDRRYAIDANKINGELAWQPAETFASGLRKTVNWYRANREWVAQIQSGAYRDWIALQYGR